ncbi:GNAT family N-acetyltransferase [Epibacterium sp. SM1979]|uniref:GNAT family N-acetyltransferase n=1 Tax=Tritonibacter litoralis TaxID=2662264 RepID=A0A843YFL8_9RHOB|nr:GNAT family N-acetyltransferase [Tritonibacter litoralis]MQQ08628.1 GNAT family N-acetyltransferase [Tritonibacter litoralis]
MHARSTINTERLTLRQPTAGDLPLYEAYCASDRTKFVRGPFSAAQAFDKFATIIGHWTLRGYGRYVIEQNGAPIGHVGPHFSGDTDAPELTWTLWTEQAEGHGFATEAARAAAQHLFADLGWDKLVIHIKAENTASRAVADRLGAKLSDDPAPAWFPNSLVYWLHAEDLK